MHTAARKAIGNVLSELMARRGYAGCTAPRPTTPRWREAAGPLAAKYTRVGLLAPRHAGGRRGQFDAGAGIGFQKQTLLKSLAELLPDEGIENLRFRVGNMDGKFDVIQEWLRNERHSEAHQAAILAGD